MTHSTSCSATVRMLLLTALRFALSLFIFYLIILTSANQHSAQTTKLGINVNLQTLGTGGLQKSEIFHPSSLPSPSAYIPEGKTQLPALKRIRKRNASSTIYLLHKLPQTFTKDCCSWNKVTYRTTKPDGTHNRASSSWTLSAFSRWVPWI